MAEMAQANLDVKMVRGTSPMRDADIHPAWARLMRYCAELGHGEIEKLKIQDGLPVVADVVRGKVKFT